MSAAAGVILLVVVMALAGCAFVIGSGSVNASVDRKVEIDPSLKVDTTVEPKKERPRD